MDDEMIVSLLLAREEKAINALKTKYEKTLKRIASNLLFDSRDVEECVSDTFMDTWDSVPPNRPIHLKGYLCSILRRNVVDRIRKNASQKRGGSVIEIPWEDCENVSGKEQDMEGVIESQHILGVINRYLKAATDRRNAVFIGRYYLGQTVKEIARELSIGKSTVNEELAAIRKDLRELLEEGDVKDEL